MQKLIRTGLFAAMAAILLPVLVLTAVGAMEGDGQPHAESTEQTQPVQEPVEQTRTDAEPAPLEPLPVAIDETSLETPDERQTIRLLTEDGERTMTIAEYLVGVLIGEIPSGFAQEAVKAQAVAARTFTLRQMESGKHDGGLCAEAGCCQAWIEPEKAAGMWGDSATAWIERVTQAIAETDGQVLTYDGELIDAVFFSCSGGRTEAAVAVWGGDVPYLIAVDSPGEEAAPRYQGEVLMTAAVFRETVLAAFPDAMLSGPPEDWFGAVEYTDGGGIATLTIGGQAIPGTALRKLLGLNSTRFTVAVEEDTIRFTTLGFGHRVGMSQYGANAMAQSGEDYSAILAHYYPGTTLERRS